MGLMSLFRSLSSPSRVTASASRRHSASAYRRGNSSATRRGTARARRPATPRSFFSSDDAPSQKPLGRQVQQTGFVPRRVFLESDLQTLIESMRQHDWSRGPTVNLPGGYTATVVPALCGLVMGSVQKHKCVSKKGQVKERKIVQDLGEHVIRISPHGRGGKGGGNGVAGGKEYRRPGRSTNRSTSTGTSANANANIIRGGRTVLPTTWGQRAGTEHSSPCTVELVTWPDKEGRGARSCIIESRVEIKPTKYRYQPSSVESFHRLESKVGHNRVLFGNLCSASSVTVYDVVFESVAEDGSRQEQTLRVADVDNDGRSAFAFKMAGADGRRMDGGRAGIAIPSNQDGWYSLYLDTWRTRT